MFCLIDSFIVNNQCSYCLIVCTGFAVSRLAIQSGNRWEVRSGSGRDRRKSLSSAETAIIGASSRQAVSPVDSSWSLSSLTILTFADFRNIPWVNGPFANNCCNITSTGFGSPLSSNFDRLTPNILGFNDSDRLRRPVILDLFFFTGDLRTGLRMKWHVSWPLLLQCSRSKPSSADRVWRRFESLTAKGLSWPISGYGASSDDVLAHSWNGPWSPSNLVARLTHADAVISEPTSIVLDWNHRIQDKFNETFIILVCTLTRDNIDKLWTLDFYSVSKILYQVRKQKVKSISESNDSMSQSCIATISLVAFRRWKLLAISR